MSPVDPQIVLLLKSYSGAGRMVRLLWGGGGRLCLCLRPPVGEGREFSPGQLREGSGDDEAVQAPEEIPVQSNWPIVRGLPLSSPTAYNPPGEVSCDQFSRIWSQQLSALTKSSPYLLRRPFKVPAVRLLRAKIPGQKPMQDQGP